MLKIRDGFVLAGFVTLSILLSLPAGAADAPGAFMKNDRWGFKVRAPKGWTRAALSADEEWIAAKAISTREMRDATEGGWYVQVPAEMWVVGFPHARKENRGARREVKGSRVTISFRSPYKDYKDFLKRERWFVGGGYHFTEEEETEIDGVKVTRYEIKIDKMVRAPLRMKTWVFHFDDIDFAVQFKILDKYYPDYRGSFLGCLRSFERIDRRKALPGGGTTGDATVVDAVNEKELTPEERERRRHEKVERTISREVENLPQGWYSMRSKHYVALSNTDKKFTRRTLNHAEAVRIYLDKKFGGIGSEYIPTGIIRIFDTPEEERAFAQSTRGFYRGATQVLVSKSVGAFKDWEFEFLSRRVTSQWMSFKNLYLTTSLPYQVRAGLEQHMAFCRSKGGKISFSPDAWDRDSLRRLIKESNALPIRNLFEASSDLRSYQHLLQSGSVVQFLMTQGNRGRWKGLIRDYLEAVIEETKRAESEYDRLEKESDKKRETAMERRRDDDDEEDEEDDLESEVEKILERLRKKSQVIRERAFNRAFGKFKDSDWRRLDAAWQKWVS